MTLIENLLWHLAEECAEVTQIASKCARFGLDSTRNGEYVITNEEHLWQEIHDVVGVITMLGALQNRLKLDENAVNNKINKIEQYLAVSAKLGTLDPNYMDEMV